jgi:hypothetical protein
MIFKPILTITPKPPIPLRILLSLREFALKLAGEVK